MGLTHVQIGGEVVCTESLVLPEFVPDSCRTSKNAVVENLLLWSITLTMELLAECLPIARGVQVPRRVVTIDREFDKSRRSIR